jgi:hypothetical protein
MDTGIRIWTRWWLLERQHTTDRIAYQSWAEKEKRETPNAAWQPTYAGVAAHRHVAPSLHPVSPLRQPRLRSTPLAAPQKHYWRQLEECVMAKFKLVDSTARCSLLFARPSHAAHSRLSGQRHDSPLPKSCRKWDPPLSQLLALIGCYSGRVPSFRLYLFQLYLVFYTWLPRFTLIFF